MKYYVVDAFAEKVFEGNPAGVCVLDKCLDEALMQNIAMENNLSETAFTYKENGKLCGNTVLYSKAELLIVDAMR